MNKVNKFGFNESTRGPNSGQFSSSSITFLVALVFNHGYSYKISSCERSLRCVRFLENLVSSNNLVWECDRGGVYTPTCPVTAQTNRLCAQKKGNNQKTKQSRMQIGVEKSATSSFECVKRPQPFLWGSNHGCDPCYCPLHFIFLHESCCSWKALRMLNKIHQQSVLATFFFHAFFVPCDLPLP